MARYRNIRSVKITKLSSSSLYCSLALEAFPYAEVEFHLRGKDTRSMNALTHDLERELVEKTIRNPRLVKAFHRSTIMSLFIAVLTCILIGWAVYSILTLLLRLLPALAISLGSNKDIILFLISDILGFIGSFTIGSILASNVSELFPVLEFRGRLSDPHTRSRSTRLQIILTIVLPIALSVIANHLS